MENMNTREIAELTGKSHTHVLRDSRRMFEALELDETKFGSIYLDTYKREKLMFELPKDLTLTLTSGYDFVQRNSIIKRWIELEEKEVGRELTIEDLFEKALEIAKTKTIESDEKTDCTEDATSLARKLSFRNKVKYRAEDVNQMLVDAGVMTRQYVGKNPSYTITEKGRDYAVKASGNAKCRRYVWREDVLNLI